MSSSAPLPTLTPNAELHHAPGDQQTQYTGTQHQPPESWVQRAFDDPVAVASLWLALATTALWLVTFGLWLTTRNMAREGNRAWLGIDVISDGDFWVSQDRLDLSVDVVCRNYGASPALNVWCGGVITFEKPGDGEIIRLVKARSPGPDAGHTIIFPDNTPEGTSVKIEHHGARPEVAPVFATIFVKYRVVGLKGWRVTAFTYTARKTGADLMYGQLSPTDFKLTTNLDGDGKTIALNNGRGALPIAT